MLRRTTAWAGTVVIAVTCLGVACPDGALADYVYCPPDGGDCYLVVEKPGEPGTPGSGGNGGGEVSRECGDEPFVGCLKPGLGYYNPEDQCFYQLASPQPPTGDPAWAGHAPGDGAVYTAACGWPGVTGFVTRWRATPPPGFGGGPSPAELAARAINQLPIRGPIIRTAPDRDGSGLVGLPVWMWTPATASTWGPVSRTASVPGLSVTATARATRIVYRMGDGSSVTCARPGTPYRSSYGNRRSPDCGYDGYDEPSSTVGGRYTISGTTTWQINWVGGGQSGSLTVTRGSATTVDIDELQVITS